jgi:hypothetical protein
LREVQESAPLLVERKVQRSGPGAPVRTRLIAKLHDDTSATGQEQSELLLVERLWVRELAHSQVANGPLELALQLEPEVHTFTHVNIVVTDDTDKMMDQLTITIHD